ncbi:hypothetical protein [Hallella sp.]|uniref:hypothetical protein n=1 Tax=Hallella sp. TaxID=2980186 RepID=UPI0028480EB6|nr:hypothetical protein [Hallella sp.]MDR3844255.1 hypothetical protein [Hallella sp.]
MNKRQLVTIIIALASLTAQAQSLVFGTVRDAFLKTPLPKAKVSLLLAADSSVVIESIPVTAKRRDDGTVREAQFMLQPEKKTCKYLLRGTLEGYEDGYLPLAIDAGNKGAIMLDDALELRKIRQVNLQEVTVTATKVKMYYRGDTIVYDATAFKLPDGSMLDDLIHQMPGVTIDEYGQIFVNGRKIDELQLGSRSFMRGNSKVLMENLPYYTVKDIKVYDQDTDLNRALNAQVERKKFVMDVNLKPEHQIGYIANVEAAGGTMERWLGRAFLLGFTERTRYTLLGNSNNVNESRHIGRSDHWTPDAVPQSLLTTHSAAGEIDYLSADKNVQENLTADFTSTRDEAEMLRRSELFLQGNPLQTTHQNSLSKAQRLKVVNRFKYVKPQGFMFNSDAAFNYRSYSGNSTTLMEQFVDSLTTRQRTDGFNDGKAWGVNGYAQIQPMLKPLGKTEQLLRITTSFDFSSDENERAQQFRVENFVNPSTANQHNATDYSQHKFSVHTPVNYSLVGKMNRLFVDINPSYSHEKTCDWLYHPDTLQLPSQIDMLRATTDPNNSYDSELQTYKTGISLQLRRLQHVPATKIMPFEADVDFLDLYLNITPMHERLNYRRGLLDTLVTRNSFRFEPRIDIHLFAKKDRHRPALIRLSHTEFNAPLVSLLSIRDDANPLVVRLGNPDLKAYTSQSKFEAEYKDIRSARHNFYVSGFYAYLHNKVSETVSFNPATGVYTYRPESVHGSYDIKVKGGIFYTLDNNKYWTVESNADALFTHWLDHMMLSGDTESHVNAVNTLTLHDNAYIQYNKGALNIRATGDIRWRHSEGKMYDFETLNATDFQYGLSARYTLPRLNTTLSADGNMYSRRGYGSSELNTDDFVLNASISQPFLKGKLIARIEAFDLLHQLSNTQYSVNAQSRTETWYRSLPHYVMAHLVYHWNRQSSKRKANLD